MALSAFMIARFVNENATVGYNNSHIEPYDFATNDLTTCTNEMNYILMSEAADYMYLRDVTDSMLLECLTTNPQRYQALDEGIFDSIKATVSKYFHKLIEFVKGIINKLKALFYKITEQYDKWLKVMRQPVLDAIRKTGSDKYKFMMFPYDETFIIKAMPASIDKAFSQWKADLDTLNGIQVAKDPGAALKSTTNYKMSTGDNTNVDNTKGQENDSSLKQWVTDTNRMTEANEQHLKEFDRTFPGKFAAFFSGVTASSPEALWEAMEKRAHSGSADKKEVRMGNNAKHYLDVIDSCKTTISNIKEAYDKHLDTLSDFKEKLDSESNNGFLDFKDEDTRNISEEAVTALRANFKSLYDYYMKVTEKYESYIGTAKERNVDYMKAMSKAYMSALTAFAGYKEEEK